MISRVNEPDLKTFGKTLSHRGVIMEWIARSRVEIDETDAKGAQREIAAAKVMVPQIDLQVIDRAVQAYGTAGVGGDTPLASMWAYMRTLRIAYGPGEVHLQQMGKNENRQNGAILQKVETQNRRNSQVMRKYGFEARL